MVLKDSFSKRIDVYRLSDVTSEKIIDALRFVFSLYGICRELMSDNAPQFISVEFANFMKENGIVHTLIPPPFHPNSNGRAEKAVQIFKKYLKAL